MKTAKQRLQELADAGFNHPPACICKRCKNGKEVYLLKSDIEAIQDDALEHAAEIAKKTVSSEKDYSQNFARDKIVEAILSTSASGKNEKTKPRANCGSRIYETQSE